MCNHENRERAMTVTARDENGTATVWCDPCLAPLIRSLNNGGIATIASCCGHGEYRGWVMLNDGPVIELHESHEAFLADRDPGLLASMKASGEFAARSINEGERNE